jgi:hypothetical protein
VTDAEAARRDCGDRGACHLTSRQQRRPEAQPAVDFKRQDWDDIIATNLTAPFLVSCRLRCPMIARRSGKISHIASLMSELARPTVVPYTAAKGGVRQLTRGMAIELAAHNIQVNAISPGYFATEMNRALIDDAEFNAWVCKRTPAGRWGQPDELAARGLPPPQRRTTSPVSSSPSMAGCRWRCKRDEAPRATLRCRGLAARGARATTLRGDRLRRSPGESEGVVAARAGLREQGFIEGQNLIAFRWAEGDYKRLPTLAVELVGLRVALLFAAGGRRRPSPRRRRLRPFRSVLCGERSRPPWAVASLSRPGGNVTGTAR